MDGQLSGSHALALLVVIWLVVLGASVVIGLAYYVVNSIAFSRFFTKVGVPGWTAWVPYYSTWKLLEVGGQPGWMVLLSLVGLGIVPEVFVIIGSWRLQIAFRKSGGHLAWAILLPPVWAFIMGARDTVYDPSLMVAAGYPPPLAGYGAVPRADPYFGSAYQSPPGPPPAGGYWSPPGPPPGA